MFDLKTSDSKIVFAALDYQNERAPDSRTACASDCFGDPEQGPSAWLQVAERSRAATRFIRIRSARHGTNCARGAGWNYAEAAVCMCGRCIRMMRLGVSW